MLTKCLNTSEPIKMRWRKRCREIAEDSRLEWEIGVWRRKACWGPGQKDSSPRGSLRLEANAEALRQVQGLASNRPSTWVSGSQVSVRISFGGMEVRSDTCQVLGPLPEGLIHSVCGGAGNPPD